MEESFAVEKKTQEIYHPTNLSPSARPTLPCVKIRKKKSSPKKFKIEKLQRFTATNISCFTVCKTGIPYSETRYAGDRVIVDR